MYYNFSILKILIITFLTFVFLDLIIGKTIYKKFIRVNFVDQDTTFSVKDDVYDHKFLPSYKTNAAGWGKKRYTFCTDANGLRSNNKEFDIGFAGDSFTEGIGVDYDKSFVGIISNKLNEKKIANLGVASYSPSIHFAKINYLLSQGYKFKEIIVFVDLSDLRDDTVCYKLDNKFIKRIDNNSNCHIIPLSRSDRLKEFLENKFILSFQLYNLIENKLIALNILSYRVPKKLINNPNSNWTYNYDSKNYKNLSFDESKNIMLTNMKKLSDLLKENQIEMSLAVYPWPGTLLKDQKENKHLKLWKAFCKANCKNFYNFMDPFFEMLKNDKFSNVYEKVYIKEDVHFNELGNEIIANNFLKLYKSR